MLSVHAAKKFASSELAMWPAGAHLEHNADISDHGHCVFLVLSCLGETLGSVTVENDGSVTTRKLPWIR